MELLIHICLHIFSNTSSLWTARQNQALGWMVNQRVGIGKYFRQYFNFLLSNLLFSYLCSTTDFEHAALGEKNTSLHSATLANPPVAENYSVFALFSGIHGRRLIAVAATDTRFRSWSSIKYVRRYDGRHYLGT